MSEASYYRSYPKTPFAVFAEYLKQHRLPVQACFRNQEAAIRIFDKLRENPEYKRVWIRDYSDPKAPQTVADTYHENTGATK